MIRPRRLAALLAAAALLAGCSGSPDKPAGDASAAPFADCAALTSAPSAGPSGGTGAAGSSAGAALPDLALPCFTGGHTVQIGQIRGPAVINLWASWCPPCRDELPVFQRLTARDGGRVHVIGVVSRDDRDAAQSLATDLGVTFPAIDDRQAALLSRVGRSALPATLFVTAAGRISYVYNATALDDATLAKMVERYLGVAEA